MSDILRRLRLSNGVMLDAEREEAAAEIERLRGALDAITTVEGNIITTDAAKSAEIERLRAAVRYAAQSIDAGVPILEVRDILLENINAT